MRARNAALATAEDLLNHERNDQPYSDPQKEDVRQTIWQFVRGGLRNGIENICNMMLRQQYIIRIKEQALNFREQLDLFDYEQIQQLAQQAKEARNATLNRTREKLSTTAKAFSKWLKEQGLGFDQLQSRYTEKAYREGRIVTRSWGSLTPEEKATVYEDIIKASGWANVIMTDFSRVMGALGAGDFDPRLRRVGYRRVGQSYVECRQGRRCPRRWIRRCGNWRYASRGYAGRGIRIKKGIESPWGGKTLCLSHCG
jgi:hypothetical protein